jgi:hypothetical protein
VHPEPVISLEPREELGTNAQKKLGDRHLEICVYTEDVYGFTSMARTAAQVL